MSARADFICDHHPLPLTEREARGRPEWAEHAYFLSAAGIIEIPISTAVKISGLRLRGDVIEGRSVKTGDWGDVSARGAALLRERGRG
jgi:hypothetical protein